MGHTTNRRHLKRIAAPRTWPIPRKGTVWIVKPSPGPHKIEFSMPIALWLRDYLKYVKTMREVRYLLNNRKIFVDGRVIRDYAFPVGLFDVLTIKDTNEHFRVLINRRGKLFLKKIDEKEKDIKPLPIIRKQQVNGGKTQLTLLDGRNVLVDDPNFAKVGDTLVIKVPEQEIVEVIKMEKGTLLYFIKGKSVGTLGKFEEIVVRKLPIPNTLVYRDMDGNISYTIKENAVAIGKENPVIDLSEL